MDGDQAGCLRCDHQVEDVASIVHHVKAGEVLHMLHQSQLIEYVGKSVVKLAAELARQIKITAT